ncbi:MAG: hypothetical protein KKD85_13750 [Proteobacteria bacterium]|nr:hypothetical protein [Pseudomonadota bacterium]
MMKYFCTKTAPGLTLASVTLFTLFPEEALAYVDPGFLSSVYQFAYIAIFGVFACLVFRPWTYLKQKFFKKGDKGSSKSEQAEE